MSFRTLSTALSIALLAGAARADTVRVPQDATSIQSAVDQAADGDVIEIRAGIYDEDVVVSGRTDLTIVGKGSVTLRATSTGVRVFESNSFKTIDPND